MRDEVDFIEKIKINITESIRRILELFTLTSAIAYIALYLISLEKLNPYFYFTLFSLYFIVGYEIRKLMKLHKSYMKVLSLTMNVNIIDRKLKIANIILIVANVVLALVLFKLLYYLIPVILILPFYLYNRIDEKIISSKEVVIVTIINIVFSVLTIYISNFVLVALATLLDLLVIELGR